MYQVMVSPWSPTLEGPILRTVAKYIIKIITRTETETKVYRAVGSNFSVVRPNSCRVMCIENLG